MGYEAALDVQRERHARVLGSRESGTPELGRILLVEHPPVVTVTKRPEAAAHIVAPPETLERLGVERRETDRGGDVTYHGPGQQVVYPIIDLNTAHLRIHAYIRLLEQSIIDTLGSYGVHALRDESATGVWVKDDGDLAKIAAIGVRVRRWITLHGLALNVDPDLGHFSLIVPCGLAGRPVTSMARVLGDACPPMGEVGDALAARLSDLLAAAGQRGETGGTGKRPGGETGAMGPL